MLRQKKDQWNDKIIEYISDEGYYRAFGNQVNDYMRRVKVEVGDKERVSDKKRFFLFSGCMCRVLVLCKRQINFLIKKKKIFS